MMCSSTKIQTAQQLAINVARAHIKLCFVGVSRACESQMIYVFKNNLQDSLLDYMLIK